MRPLCLAILLTLPISACSLPGEEAGFASRNPGTRVRAAALAEKPEDERMFRELIAMLDSEDPAARMVASAALRRRTGQDFGYQATAPRGERQVAADRWEAWYRRTYLGQNAPDPAPVDLENAPRRTTEASASQ